MTYNKTLSLTFYGLIAALLVFMSSILIATFALTTNVQALTDAQKKSCFNNWNGATVRYGTDRDRQYNSSVCKDVACDTSEVSTPGLGGYRVTCPNPDKSEAEGGGSLQPNSEVGKIPGDAQCDGGPNCCNGVKTSIAFNCPSGGSGVAANPIFSLLFAVINFLAIGVGVAVTGGIVYGAIRYIAANGNSGQTQEAIKIMINAGVALVVFGLMYAIVNFLDPGGLFT